MKLIILVGPCGSGKSTHASILEQEGYFRISQDDQGKAKHHELFAEALRLRKNIVVDRMNFSKHQRDKYSMPAKMVGYEVEMIVFHVPRDVCFERMMTRKGHPTINGMEKLPKIHKNDGDSYIVSNEEKVRQANSALDTFFTQYERVQDTEADKVTRLGWDGKKQNEPMWGAMIVDLDGTLCNIDHRLHYVKNEDKKKRRWDLFLAEVGKDSVNEWCRQLVRGAHYHPVIFCSGRGDQTRKDTEAWLLKHGFATEHGKSYRHLFMRHRNDSRQDYIIKEIILDFEILPRYHIWMCVDDRQQVVDMYRGRGLTVLQCAPGDF